MIPTAAGGSTASCGVTCPGCALTVHAAQVLFLLYHYFNAREIYNAIRVFIAGYVWMTGFGNFSYYYKTKDFCLGRYKPWSLCLSLVSVFLHVRQDEAHVHVMAWLAGCHAAHASCQDSSPVLGTARAGCGRPRRPCGAGSMAMMWRHLYILEFLGLW